MNHNAPHYVYRCYGADGTLLYVGCTHDVATRMQVHASAWNNPASALLNLRMASYTEEEFPNFEEGRAAERSAIAEEAPLANLHHQRKRITPAERARRIDAYFDATRPATDPEFVAWLEESDAAVRARLASPGAA